MLLLVFFFCQKMKERKDAAASSPRAYDASGSTSAYGGGRYRFATLMAEGCGSWSDRQQASCRVAVLNSHLFIHVMSYPESMGAHRGGMGEEGAVAGGYGASTYLEDRSCRSSESGGKICCSDSFLGHIPCA